jgi:hypothetical protein
MNCLASLNHFRLALFTLSFFILIHGISHADSTDEVEKTSQKDLLQSIYLGQDWLNNFQKDTGLYHYIFRPWGFIMTPEEKAEEEQAIQNLMQAPGEKQEIRPSSKTVAYPDDDNIVRQILSYWAQIKSTPFRNNPETMENIKNFEKGLEPYIVIEDSLYGKALFIDFRDGMKVNSTALYLAALLSKKEVGLELTEDQKKHIHYSANGLRFFSAPKDGFYYYHNTDRINFITSYGSGEAQYALAQYLNHYPNDELYEWTKNKFTEYFETHFQDSFTTPLSFMDKERVGYHTWALY